MSKKFTRDDIDRLHEYGIHVPSRTLYLGSINKDYDGGEEAGVDFLLAERMIKNIFVLESISSEPITIIMNNVGGDWFHGMAIYDAIVHCKCHITVIVYGQAMSMATIILQAADDRVMMPNSELMIHDGNEAYEGTPKAFEAWAEQSKKNRMKMYEIYALKSNRPVSFWEKKCSNDYFITSEESIEIGLADRIAKNKE